MEDWHYESGDKVWLHFFGSDRGELGTVTWAVDGQPREFEDSWGNRVAPEGVVHFNPTKSTIALRGHEMASIVMGADDLFGIPTRT